MIDSPTVLVTGGGATGTGIARDLALRGVEGALVEREGLVSGASGRSHGLLHSGARYAEADPVGAEECIVERRILDSVAGACIRDTGGLFVQLPGDDAAYFDEKRAACEEIGIETSVRECAAMLPPVADAPTIRTWWGVRPLYAPDERTSRRRGISRSFFTLNHAADGVDNFASVVGGKLTTYRKMAAAASDHVCDTLGIDLTSETATRPLPDADDPGRLDELVGAYDGQGPTDADISQHP